MRVFITGGTGFIGREIVCHLRDRGDQPVVLSRNVERARAQLAGVEVVEGDPVYGGSWQAAVDGCDAAIGLAGESIGGQRWNAQFKQRLQDSRVDSTRNLVDAIRAAQRGPTVLVSASAIDYYPWAEELDAHTAVFEDDPVDESTPPGSSFLARVCRHWEEEALRARPECRVVLMRTGLVLGHGGVLDRMDKLFKLGAGGPLGSGQQWTSWVHLSDVVRAYLHALDSSTLLGPVNVVAPENARQVDLARTLARALSRPAWIRAPRFAVRAAAGELADYLLHGRRAVPAALEADGFEFRYKELADALAAIYSRN